MNEVGFGRATYPSGRVCRHSGHYIRKTLLEINKMLAVISGVLRRCSCHPRYWGKSENNTLFYWIPEQARE